ncbi:MAG TPA: hypothetical protein VGK70_15005 [Thermoanaerobaculia bacterium]
MKRLGLLILAALTLAASVASAYNIKLKDGSIIFARSKYEVKGNKAIITLPNGTVTQIDLATIDIPGTEQYNKENPGNVIALVPGEDKEIKLPVLKPPPTVSLQDMLRQRKTHLGVPPPKAAGGAAEAEASGTSWQAPEPAVELAFRRVLDGAAITQYRLTSYRGKLRLVATTSSEEAVFNMLSASARALTDLQDKGKPTVVEIVLTTPSGEPAGSFEMSSENARQIVNGTVTVADYFVRNVIL